MGRNKIEIMKTTDEIYNEIIAEKESGSYSELDELNSTSKVAIWRLWVWIFSFFSKTLWELFEDLKNWIKDYFARKQVGTLLWWIDQVKAFQYGDELQFIDGIWQYIAVDETKQIVKQVALGYERGLLVFKVAKENSGNLEPLTSDEQQALLAYLNKIKMPGQFLDVYSGNADKVKLHYKVYYNAEIPQTDLQTAIEQAINDYIANIVFNGLFVITEVTDILQAIDGVENPVYIDGQYSNDNQPQWQELGDYYRALSGYFELDSINIDFIANV